MKRPSSDQAWIALTHRARADLPPPLDLPALLHRLETTPVEPAAPSFLEGFAACFATRRALVACAAFTTVCACLATWQSRETWHELSPWIELLYLTIGGPST